MVHPAGASAAWTSPVYPSSEESLSGGSSSLESLGAVRAAPTAVANGPATVAPAAAATNGPAAGPRAIAGRAAAAT